MTHEELTGFARRLELRKEWYQKAVAMLDGTVEWENGFNWPDREALLTQGFPGNKQPFMLKWRGTASELQNTLDMLRYYLRRSEQKECFTEFTPQDVPADKKMRATV